MASHPPLPVPTLLLSACCALAIPTHAPADDATVYLPPMSVTATRTPIRSFDFPGMVSVTGRDAIETRQPSSLGDVLQSVPNVEFTGGPRRTGEVPSVRGFSGPDVVLLLDGARQNFGSAHDGRVFVAPEVLREVEVLRGPASALYGSGGTGGVIEMRTIRASDLLRDDETAGISIAGRWQSVNREKSATVTAYGRPTEGLDLVGSVTRLGSGSIELGDGNELTRSDDDVVSALLKGGFRFADHYRVEGSFQHFGNEAQEPNNGQGTGGDDLVEKDIHSDTWRLAFGYHNPDDDLLDLDLVLYSAETGNDETRLDGNGAGPVGEVLRRDVDTLGFRVDNRTRIRVSETARAILTLGTEAYQDRQDGSTGAGERDGVPDADADFQGAFAQAEISLDHPLGLLPGELLLLPGIRYDRFETSSALATATTSDSELSPRLGASYMPNDWLMLFASRSQAFRAPTFDEAYLSGTHFTIPIAPGATVINHFVPNANLRPQRTDTWELGAGLSFQGLVTGEDLLELKGSYFRTRGKDFIDLRVDQPAPFADCFPFIPGACDGTTTSANVANAVLWGRELEGSYENHRVRLRLGVSDLRGKNVATGAYLGVLTPPQVDLDVGIKLPRFDLLVGWRLHAATAFDQVNAESERRAGYGVHDFYLAWAPEHRLLDGLRVDLGLDNAFDKAWSRVFTDALEPGRNMKASVSWQVGW